MKRGSCCWLWMLAVTGWCQSTTGSLQGVVVDPTGAAIPAANITLRQLASGATRTLASGESGEFQVTGLAVGAYSLRAEKSGLAPASVESLTISIGQTALQRVVMTPAAVTSQLEVQEEPEALQSTATAAGVVLGGERIEEAPAPNRSYLSFVLTAPGVTTSPGTNNHRAMVGLRNAANDSGFTAHGLRGRNNSIAIDGVDNRDETTGGNRVAIGLEMIQEFRVSATSVNAELGGAAGALVNIVTRTGQNLWHGDATYFQQNEALNARNPEVETGAKPQFRRYQPGVSVGGPIQHDRTFFFLAAEQSWENSGEWSEAPRRSLPQLQAALAGAMFARAGTSSLLAGVFPISESDTEFALKASHLAAHGNTFSGRYAYSRGSVRRDVQGGDNFTDRSARGSSVTADHSLVLGWLAAPGPVWVNDLRLQVSQRDATLRPNAGGPMFEVPGVVTFGQNYRLNQSRTERHVEVVESLQRSLGKHLLSTGASVHGVSFDGRLAGRYGGVYVFPTVADLLAGQPDLAVQTFGDPHTSMRTTPVGLWLQDQWRPANGLTIDLGVRYDRQWLPAPFPSPNRNVAPRLGIAWHPGDSGWVFRAAAGLFYDRYPLAYLNEALQKDGRRGFEQYLTGVQAVAAFTQAQGGTLLSPVAGVAPSLTVPAPGFTSTYSRKLTFGVERRLNRDTTLTAEFSDVRGLHLPRLRNAALTLPPQYHLEQTARSAYRGLTTTVNRRLSRELTYLLTYQLSTTRDDASDYEEQPLDPANLRAEWALSRQHQRHRIALSGLYELPDIAVEAVPEWLQEGLGNITIAPVFSWGSGRPLNTLLTTDVYRTGAYPLSARPPRVPRNSQLAPRMVSLDVRVMKTIPFANDRSRLQFGAEAFNLLNHTNRLRVNPYLTPAFGAMVEAQNPRQVQLLVQFEY